MDAPFPFGFPAPTAFYLSVYVAALVQLLNWRKQGQPNEWLPPSESTHREVVARIQSYLDEVGTAPGSDFGHARSQEPVMRVLVPPSGGIASPPEGETPTGGESEPPAAPTEETP